MEFDDNTRNILRERWNYVMDILDRDRYGNASSDELTMAYYVVNEIAERINQGLRNRIDNEILQYLQTQNIAIFPRERYAPRVPSPTQILTPQQRYIPSPGTGVELGTMPTIRAPSPSQVPTPTQFTTTSRVGGGWREAGVIPTLRASSPSQVPTPNQFITRAPSPAQVPIPTQFITRAPSPAQVPIPTRLTTIR